MKKVTLIMFLSLFSLIASSQTEVVEFLRGGKEDATKVVNAYLQPYAYALGDGLNNGWYNTAATHHLFGFDITVGVSAVQVPEGSQTFDINKLGLSNMRVATGSSLAPTVAGAETQGPRITVYDRNVSDPNANSLVEFNSPQGTGLDVVPVPMIQLGFGLLPNTDLVGRFVPEMKFSNKGDEMKFGLWGLGVKHNFMGWIPGLKTLPFDASLFASYSEVSGDSELSFTTAAYSSNPNIRIEAVDTDDQFLKLKTKTTKIGLIVSKKFSILTVFGAIGESMSKSTIDLVGTYPVVATASGGGYEVTQQGALVNPVALSFDTNNLSMEAGLRIKLAVLSLFGSVNKSEYTSYTAGVSLGFR